MAEAQKNAKCRRENRANENDIAPKEHIRIWDLLKVENGVELSWYFQMIMQYFR